MAAKHRSSSVAHWPSGPNDNIGIRTCETCDVYEERKIVTGKDEKGETIYDIELKEFERTNVFVTQGNQLMLDSSSNPIKKIACIAWESIDDCIEYSIESNSTISSDG